MTVLEADLLVRVLEAEPVWSAARDAPELLAHVPDELREQVHALATGVPGLRSVAPLAEPTLARPPTHRRAFYVRARSGAVLGIKGTEPHAYDFGALLEELEGARVHVELRLGNPLVDRTLTRAELTALEKFPLLEGKVPGCVTLREALADARSALAVQRAHLQKHGEPARLPLPVFVGRWSDDTGEAVLAALRSRLHGRAWDVVEPSVRAGLGVYVYAYPTLPSRLIELVVPDATRRRELAIRREALRAVLDPARLFERWVALAARLIALGFVPKDPATLVTGDCLQVQNLVLDGGFADTESLVACDALSDRALRDALRRTAHELAIAATRLLVGMWASTVDFRDRVPDLFATVWRALAVEVLRHPELADPRVRELLEPSGSTYDALDQILRTSI